MRLSLYFLVGDLRRKWTKRLGKFATNSLIRLCPRCSSFLSHKFHFSNNYPHKNAHLSIIFAIISSCYWGPTRVFLSTNFTHSISPNECLFFLNSSKFAKKSFPVMFFKPHYTFGLNLFACFWISNRKRRSIRNVQSCLINSEKLEMLECGCRNKRYFRRKTHWESTPCETWR